MREPWAIYESNRLTLQRIETMSNQQLSISRYPAYQDSGIEWLGEIPEHWCVKRLKELILGPLSYGANESASDANPDHPRFIRITDFSDQEELKKDTFKSLNPDRAKKFILKEGDLLFARSGATVGKTFHLKNYTGQACYAGYLIKVRPKQSVIISDFLSYYTKSSVYNNWKNSMVIKSTIENISAEKYGSFLFIPIPPLVEQKAIAHYLDTKTYQIDQKIALLTQKVTLYNSLKQSVINETVTQGLDQTVPMKDSGIEAIGAIPEHWQIKRLKDIALIQFSHVDKKTYAHEIPVYLCSYTDVYKNDIIDSSLGFMKATASLLEIKKFAVNKDDILVTKDSETSADIAISALVNESLSGVVCGYHLAQIRSKHQSIYSPYLFRLLQSKSYRLRFIINAKGVTRAGLNISAFTDALTPIPTLAEQKAIADYLDKRTTQIDKIIDTIKHQIDHLKELRKTLINDIVTGKINIINSYSKFEVDQVQ